jgi:hypothetical protein
MNVLVEAVCETQSVPVQPVQIRGFDRQFAADAKGAKGLVVGE